MSNPLEDYLKKFRSHLNSLPSAERDIEVEEARQHLFALIQRRLEAGDSQEVAVATAIKQFGNARDNGQAIHQIWRRKNHLDRTLYLRSALHALLASITAGTSLVHLSRTLVSAKPSLPWPGVVALLCLGVFAVLSLRFARTLRTAFFGVFAVLMVTNAASDLSRWGFLPSLYVSYFLELTLLSLSSVALGLEMTRHKNTFIDPLG